MSKKAAAKVAKPAARAAPSAAGRPAAAAPSPTVSGPKVYERKLTDFLPDTSNANKGTVRGRKLLGESLSKMGAARSLVSDANNRIPAGNKSLQAMVEAGFENALVVETDGRTPVIVKRTDWDLNDPKGAARKYAYYDNRVAELDLDWDRDELIKSLEAGLELSDLWGERELAALLGTKTLVGDNDDLLGGGLCPTCGARIGVETAHG